MKLIFTNGFSKKNNPDELEINIKGKCQITNYDPREKTPEKKGDLTVTVNGDNSSQIKNGSVEQEDSKTVKLNSKKFSIFSEIAKLDGNSSTLTQEDLETAWNSYNKKDEKWTTLFEAGVTEIKYDSHAGVATFVIGKKEILRIDFQTWREQFGLKNDSKKLSVKEKENIEIETAKTDSMDVFYNSIPEEYNKYITSVAKETGVSENFVKYMILVEGKNSKAKLNAYKCSNGVWTIGFGHTNLTDNAKNGNGFVESAETTITIQQAFQFLAADIKEHKKYCKDWLGEDFENSPISVQEGLIDRSFQAGQRGFKNETLKANLDSEIYPAVVARNLWVPNDTRRSGLRFLTSTQGLDTDSQTSAKKRFIQLGYYQEVKNGLTGKEKKTFIQTFDKLGN